MNDLQKSNLATVAKALLTEKFNVGFDMSDYARPITVVESALDTVDLQREPCSLKNECGTTACFAGHGPLVLGPSEQPLLTNLTHRSEWAIYVAVTFGSEHLSFLFGPRWSNDPRQAAARAYHILSGKPYDYPFKQESGHDVTFPVPKPEDFDPFILSW